MLRHRVPGLRVLAVALATTVAVGPTVASAAPAKPKTAPGAEPAQPVQPVPAEAGDPLTTAQQLYDRGRAKFETADYRAAIELWTEAYATVPDTPQGNQVKVLLIYNLATAREKAFDVSRDPGELRQAQILLRNFEQSIVALYGEGEEAEAERVKVQERIAALDGRLAEHEAARAEDEDEDDGEDQAQGDGDGEDQADDSSQAPAPSATEPVADQPVPGRRGLVIAGSAVALLGAVGLGVMAGGIGMGARANDLSRLEPDDLEGRRAQFERGRAGNMIAIIGGAAGGALLVSGAVLLGLGLRRGSSERAVAVHPAVGAGRAGLVLQGRF